MLERLQYVKQRFDEISDLIIQPDIISDQKRYVQLNQEYKGLKALMEKREELINVSGNIEEANEILEVPAYDANRGGLLMELEGIRGFLPVSQLSADHYPRVSGADKDEILQKLN